MLSDFVSKVLILSLNDITPMHFYVQIRQNLYNWLNNFSANTQHRHDLIAGKICKMAVLEIKLL